jgi:hypothetical protein
LGDDILKTQLLALTLFATLLQADTSTSWIDQKVEEIKPQRQGLNTSTINTLKSPFIVIRAESDGPVSTGAKTVSSDASKKAEPEKDMSQEPLTLQAVLNTSALINGKWLKESAVIRGYTLVEVRNDYVMLEQKNKKLKLFIAQKSKNLNISTK